jgi:4-hydroxymandelate synthase
MTTTFDDLRVDHVEFYVADAARAAADLVTRYGFEACAVSGGRDADHYSVALRQHRNVVVFTEALDETHPASFYVQQHGDGVGNIALRTGDVEGVFTAAVARGARPVAYADRTAAIGAFGDVLHTFVHRPDHAPDGEIPPGFRPATGVELELPAPAGATGLREMDHFAVCLEADGLDPTVEFYASVLGFHPIFEERIVVGAQAMLSRVVQSRSGDVTLTLIEPDTSAQPGQIDEFVKNHGGPGVQHIAFRTDDIVDSIATLMRRDVAFLTPPDAYYQLLMRRLELARYRVDELQARGILVDSDHDGQLFQIFARSTHPRRTFFFEVIERLGASTFGSGNIKALYEAVEAERLQTRDML